MPITRTRTAPSLATCSLATHITPLTRIYVILSAQGTDAASPDLAYPEFDDPNNFFYNSSYFGKLGVSSTLLDGRLQHRSVRRPVAGSVA